MIGRVVEIATDRRHLALSRGFMTISTEGTEIGRIPLDDIAVVLCNAHGLTYSNNLLVELGRRGTAMVFCGADHLPTALLWPVEGHHLQTLRMRHQLSASVALKNRLWQALVASKIRQQGAVLSRIGVPGTAFEAIARKVRSGDPENQEAQAARRYWPLLMGAEFRRDRAAAGANALLNYGYTILRSGAARAVAAAGLHPSVGLHHSNRGNSLCLVDDVMEPFRPLVDFQVWRLLAAGELEPTPSVKATLAAVLTRDLPTSRGTTPVITCLERLAASLATSFELGKSQLDLPDVPGPWEWSNALK